MVCREGHFCIVKVGCPEKTVVPSQAVVNFTGILLPRVMVRRGDPQLPPVPPIGESNPVKERTCRVAVKVHWLVLPTSSATVAVTVVTPAESVLAGHWPVNDKATSQLMTEFMCRWHSGEPRAQAWREAQLSLLRSRDFANPYFWAAFTLTGQWR